MPADRGFSVGPIPRQRRSADGISRRILIGGVSSATVASAVDARWAHKLVSDGAGGYAPDTELSAAFQANARGFYAAALAGQDRFPGQAAHFLAIAIELSLKSYLLHRGFSDDWNRIHIGHDLVKALSCACRAGFHDVPSDLPGVIALLSPAYLHHAFHKLSPETVATLRGLGAYDAVRVLFDGVNTAIRQATPVGWSAPPRFR
jgi:hypothetical protein